MADNTAIEWAKSSWNAITGCTPIPEEPGNPSGCSRCYARRMANRLRGRHGYPADDPFQPGTMHPDKLHDPDGWKKPRRIFVSSMGDIFHEQVRGRDINQVWNVALNNPRHTFMFLTKRPRLALEWTRKAARVKCWPAEDIWPNWMWIGTTVENQKRADERIPDLLRIKAAVHFVSYEPALAPVDFTRIQWKKGVPLADVLRGGNWGDYGPGFTQHSDMNILAWVICGAETGPGKREMKTEWARDARDQCVAAGVPFFFKKDSRGKRLLDGRTWEQFPEVGS